jgi:serine/threonine protein kinase/WD40 repeat protein
MSISGSGQYDLLDQLAEEFAARFRRGERPSLKEYTERYPALADDIRKLFPALVEVEQADAFGPGEEVTGETPASTPHLSQVGDYRVLREIGRGGMGVVYEAEQISLGRRVALKVLPRHASSNRMVLERFRREARAAARLHHTNIVPVFEVGQEGDIRFYAMQFIQGQSLDLVIEELRRLRKGASAALRPGSSALDMSSGLPHGVLPNPVGGESTPGEEAEISRIVHAVLTGRFDPGGLPAVAVSERTADPGAAQLRTELPTAPEKGSGGAGSSCLSALAPSLSDSPSTSSSVLPGGTQLSSIESGRRAFYRSLAHIGRQVAGALAHAHARGIVHRDIKPSNLLLDTDGVAWITDFGLAKGDEQGLTQSGDILGTLRYMAPERFRGGGDARADVYALGLTLYELLTLHPGFDSSDRLKLIEQIKTQEPPKPRSVDARIPRDLETIVLKAIEKDPKARYQTAEAMGEDLGRFLADEPIEARQVSAAERYWRWARRNPVIAVLGGVLTGVLIVVTVVSILTAAYFRESARRESNLAAREKFANQRSQEAQKAAIDAQHQAIVERDKSQRLSAGLTFEKGLTLAEEGQADQGLHWMLEALETAPEEPAEFRRMVRRNLGAWLGQVHKPLRILDLEGPCKSGAFSPDGRSFVTEDVPFDTSRPALTHLWDTVSGRRLATFSGSNGPFTFHPNGKVLLANAADREHVVALDLAKGQTLWSTPKLPRGTYSIIVSRDGTTVFTTRPAVLHQWNAFTGRPIGEPYPLGRVLLWPPDGRLRATESHEEGTLTIRLMDSLSGRQVASWAARDARASWIGLAINPDGRSLVETTRIDLGDNPNNFSTQIRDLRTGRPISPLMVQTECAGYTPAGDRLLTWTDGLILVREAATGRVRGAGFPRAERSVHPEGRLVFSIDGTRGFLWEISPDAEPAAVRVGLDETARGTGGTASSPEGRDYRLFWAGLRADGRLAASLARGPGGREVIRFRDPATGRPIGRPARHASGWHVRTAAFSPDGRCFATGSDPHPPGLAGEVRLWDTATGRLRFPPMLHTNYVAALAFQPDGQVLAAGDYNGLVRFWDTTTGREVGRPLRLGEIVLSLAYSPDGQVLAVGLAHDRTGKPGAQLWDVATRQPRGGVLPTSEDVTRVEFRPDGQALLANASSSRLWYAARGQAIGEPMVDEESGSFSADGRAFLTLERKWSGGYGGSSCATPPPARSWVSP